MKRRPGPTDFLLAALSALTLIGALTFFKTCGPREDGSWMNCHWANQTVTGLAAVMTVLSIARFFLGDGEKIGLDLSQIALAVLTAVLPGNLIPLCGMETMRCHTVFQPAALVLSVLTAAAALADAILRARRQASRQGRREPQ